MNAIAMASTGHSSGGSALIMIVWGVFAMGIGVLHAINPQFGWRMSRWRYRNPEAMRPSDAALTLTRVGGGVFVVIGAVFLVIGLTKL